VEGAVTIFVCKMCGRSLRQDEKPNWCYFDRCDSIENISDEDAVKMGLSIPEGERFEFPGDVRWDPDSGRPMDAGPGDTLREFQRAVMAEVRQT
jgi:hypothetical protein